MIIGFVLLMGFLALFVAALLTSKIMKKSPGNKKMQHISQLIHKGAMTFLNKEYRVMIVFMVVVAFILYYFLPNGWKLAIAFVFGSIFSAVAGRVGMYIATHSNARTAWGAKKSLNEGLKIAFSSGLVMGLSVVGLAVLGITIFYLLWNDPEIIYSFGFGASYVALFARVGGGIFTKAADIGADLVGKVEAGIPEDDPRNPAVIADNVGDNVGDVAGMGADLFESYVESIVAAMAIGFASFIANKDAFATVNVANVILLPLALSAFGIIASIAGMFFVRIGKKANLYAAINKGFFAASAIMLIGAYFLIEWMVNDVNIFYAVLFGLGTGIIIGLSTEYYTSSKRRPTRSIAEAAKTGAATDLIEGLAVGMWSTIIPVLAVSFAILASYHFGGLYGIAIASVGMLSTLGITLAADSYGPVADNAAGISQMAGLGKNVRKRTEILDEVGNTTAAIGKGFAIGSAALTSLVLYVGFAEVTGIKIINIANPTVIVGLFIGGLLPFVFCALLMEAVGKAAFKMIKEVRRQFKHIKGIMKGEAEPDYEKCMAISTHAALQQMIVPGLLAVTVPIVVGIVLGAEALGGLLVGKSVVGFLMAVFMTNAGAAWDNAKKYIEEGHFGGKGSPAFKAAVIGDTVGDPYKDTAGPALNILIKLMGIVALVFVPLFI